MSEEKKCDYVDGEIARMQKAMARAEVFKGMPVFMASAMAYLYCDKEAAGIIIATETFAAGARLGARLSKSLANGSQEPIAQRAEGVSRPVPFPVARSPSDTPAFTSTTLPKSSRATGRVTANGCGRPPLLPASSAALQG